VLLALVPTPLLIIAAVWTVVFTFTRFVSLGSIAASFSLPFAVWVTGGSTMMILLTAGLALLAIYKHRANIQRLIHGQEHRIRFGHKEGTS
jgi:glycerol-3-phosphate acyltransferase PlsY